MDLYFRDSDASDDDYEEVEMQAEEDYDEEDDYLLGGESIAACAKEAYDNNWSAKASGVASEKFQTQNMQVGPSSNHKTELDAFTAIVSPGIINISKFGVDIFDEMLGSNSYRPPVKRWPLRIFMAFIVGGAAINAHVLHGREVPRREFTNKLADQLMEGQKERRSNDGHWTTKVFVEISGLYKGLHDKIAGSAESQTNWCHICNKVGRGIKMQLCSACKKIACEEHSVNQTICTNCHQKEEKNPSKMITRSSLAPKTTSGYCHSTPGTFTSCPSIPTQSSSMPTYSPGRAT
uniref:PiggyBac transposable element-derived protein domain-containing protein n=1 Tax=Ditylenchus dipsaci TaxID=166011 RepID=A0A915EDZ1_9BILA